MLPQWVSFLPPPPGLPDPFERQWFQRCRDQQLRLVAEATNVVNAWGPSRAKTCAKAVLALLEAAETPQQTATAYTFFANNDSQLPDHLLPTIRDACSWCFLATSGADKERFAAVVARAFANSSMVEEDLRAIFVLSGGRCLESEGLSWPSDKHRRRRVAATRR